MGKVPLPGDDEASPPKPFTVEDFGTLNTKAQRPAIDPKEFSWIENWMPIGPGNMRTLYAEEGTPLYSASGGRNIIYFAAYNIESDEYLAVFLDDGTADQVSIETGAITPISATSGKFYTLGSRLPAVAQYQSKYLAIAALISDDAYWIWDGTSLFGAGTLEPQITILNSGKNYSSAPTVTAYGGAGSGATFLATVQNNTVTEIEVTNSGSGYLLNDQVTLVITGGGSDNQARATATVSTTTGGVALVEVTNGGSGYTVPLVTFAGGGGAGAKAFVSGAANGVITEITVTDPGTGYTSNPTVTVAGGGAGCTAVAQIRKGQITGITVNSGGTGYVGTPDIVISEPDDFGFPLIQAEATATVVAGVLTAITVNVAGVGYRSATVDISGGNNSAEATVKLMPFGISGSTIETYQSRVWVSEDTKTSFTGPGSVSNFSTIGGGGSYPATDSFLRERIVRLAQSNGFLYQFGDSSINVISNVQTSSAGSTTFNNSNVDPQIGSAWRDSVVAFGRALVFANPTGVYALYGGAAEKVSGPLDGLFANATFNTGTAGGITPTAAVATIFGIRVYMLSFTTIDPYTNIQRDLMCMWDGQKWFAGTQLSQPNFVTTQQINSELTSWGTDGATIYRLFQEPSDQLLKIFQTKLLASPVYFIYNRVQRVYFLARSEGLDNQELMISIDTEKGSGAAMSRPVNNTLQFVGSGPITFVGSGPITWLSAGLIIDGYDDSNFGRLIGATCSTLSSDLTMISLTLLLNEHAPFA